nr:zinc finger, CCHC-type, retrotransposon Gag domain protein [Tanacetum cinerariifolium]
MGTKFRVDALDIRKFPSDGSLMGLTKLKPLAFQSAATPAEAEDWITHMEKLFQVLGYLDNFKTRLAAFKLEGDALSWWK